MSGYYDTAQICLNGHVINGNVRDFPSHNAEYCTTCGEKTIIQCSSCNTAIRGSFEVPGAIVIGASAAIDVPAFCHKCGKAYQWTDRRLQSARALADELDELTFEEKERLKGSVDDLVAGGPAIEVAAVRFKKVMSKVGKASYEGMKRILTDLLSEAAKQAILGP